MANSSIYAAFERMWQHIIAKIGTKADLAHNHDDIYYTEAEIDTALLAKADKVHNHDGVYAPADTLESAQVYADNAANKAATTLKNELLNGAGAAYDTLKELGDLIDDNVDAIDALEIVAAGKADKEHTHDTYETKVDAQIKYDTITSAKADWNQNDETAIDYVKNRTHWAEVSKEVVFEEQSVVLTNNATLGHNSASLTQVQDISLAEGEFFVVTINGISYICASWMDASYDINTFFVGDSRLLGDAAINNIYYTNQEDVPFLLEFYFEDDGWFSDNTLASSYIYMPTTIDSCTLKIELENKDQTTYHTLDERYIPDSIARVDNVITRINPVVEGSFSLNRKLGSEIGYYSFSEGAETIASGIASHAEGDGTVASGGYSHAEGQNTTASGRASHAEGWHTIASSENQHVQGKLNIEDTNETYSHIVGNGTSNNTRSNAHTLDWSGNAWFSGDVYVGSTSGTNKDEGSKKLATEEYTKEYVDTQIASIPSPDLSVYETKEDAQVKYDEITSAKADWNQNDKNDIDYIKNRTHWVNEVINGSSVIIQATTETSVSGSDLNPGSSLMYLVTVDGVEYQCEPYYNTYGEFCLGDSRLAIAYDDNGEEIPDPSNPMDVPFLVNNYEDDGGGMLDYELTYEWTFYYPDDNAHTIEIVSLDVSRTYHTLDDEYIPDTIYRKNEVLDLLSSKLSSKMENENPKGTGSFSMNRKSGTTKGDNSSTLGTNCTASGEDSHAEGYLTIASGDRSHAEGLRTTASSYASHAEGNETTASGDYSHAEGHSTTASSYASHAEGNETTASGMYSHAEGNETTASGMYSHAEGNGTTASGKYSHAEGNGTTASGTSSHAEGRGTFAIGTESHAEGANAVAYQYYAHAEGCGGVIDTTITGDASATTYTLASSNDKIKIGQVIGCNGKFSKITAYDSSVPSITVLTTLSTEALSSASAHIYQLAASGMKSHAEGSSTIASGDTSHAEGDDTVASGGRSHAEGKSTTASGGMSHAEGSGTVASGSFSHAEGTYSVASGNTSHAEGNNTVASGIVSHAEGSNTIASGKYSHVQGKYNIEDTNETYSHIVGNGTADNARSNAHTLDWSGNAWFAGDVYVGSTGGKNKDNGSRKLASITETWTFTLEDGSTVTKAVYVG